MNQPERSFQQHCIDGARAFIQTAIVIDNEANHGGIEETSPTPRIATRAASSAFRLQTNSGGGTALTNPPSPPAAQAEPAKEAEDDQPPAPQLPEVAINNKPPAAQSANAVVDNQPLDVDIASNRASAEELPERVPDVGSHELKAKELTEAFFRQEVICGVYKPAAGEDFVETFAAAAQHADIVIIDWFLEPHSSLSARKIIRKILKRDAEENGRLRLIAVYTSAPNLADLPGELLQAIEQEKGFSGKLRAESGTLVGQDTRICFLNKPNTLGAQANTVVSEADLPERLIKEFAVLTEGVLATYAVASIAAVRRAVHNVIAIFRKDLDGAYVAHRCSIPHPDDAKDFAKELITSALGNVISMAAAADRCVSSDVLESWIDHISGQGRTFSTELAQATPDLVKEIIRKGAPLLAESKQRQTLVTDPQTAPSNTARIHNKNIAEIFYNSSDEARVRNREFARLSTFKREAGGMVTLPPDWSPCLTLGCVLKVFPEPRPTSEALRSYYDLPFECYLVCLQPRCDSVRLKTQTAFPFQLATAGNDRFNLVVRDQLELLVGYKPRDTVMLSFLPDQNLGVVKAAKNAEGEYVFQDVKGRQFTWIGDLRDLKAQKDASEMAASVHRVGIDELEWLRLAGTGEVRAHN